MKRFILVISAICSVVLSGAVFVQSASARTMNACYARPTNGANWTYTRCDSTGVASGSYGLRAAAGGSPATIDYRWALPIDSVATYTVIVRAAENGGSGYVTCYVTSLNANGGVISTTASQTTANNTTVQTLTFYTASIPAGGAILATCTLSANNNSKVISMDWF